MLVVHKFGGTSVGSAERIAAVADIVGEQYATTTMGARDGIVVVVSAMSGVTNQLLNGAWAAAEGRTGDYERVLARLAERHQQAIETLFPAGEMLDSLSGLVTQRLQDLRRLYESIAVLGELTARGRDHVAAFGEQLSAHILAALLRLRGVPAEPLMATELIVTDDHFGAAKPLLAKTRDRLQARLRPLLAEGVVPVVTGFIAATEAGTTTTLGRGGSDYTAAIVGAGLDADEVWIWSDVDGILTADPNLVPQARTLRELSYAEAAELAYYGADVLHPKTIQPVIASRIPLRILNSFNPADPGTLIVADPDPGRERLPAIISTEGLTLITIGGRDDTWSLLEVARTLQSLSEAGIEVPMFSQSFSEHTLNLVVRGQDQERCLRTLRTLYLGPLTAGDLVLEAKERVATVSVVGVPDWNEMGVVQHVFAAVGDLGTRVIAVAQAATETSVSFCIPEDQVAATVRHLHRHLEMDHDVGSQGGSAS